jgi:hypothetical protein
MGAAPVRNSWGWYLQLCHMLPLLQVLYELPPGIDISQAAAAASSADEDVGDAAATEAASDQT